MQSRIQKIREEERKYHETCYNTHQLFEQGSWLHKPVQTVLDALSNFDSSPCVKVLDLGCGVGRNSIPIAESLRGREGGVICVDLLESALTKLTRYSQAYGVDEYIETKCCDIGDYDIAPGEFDYIVSVSALEHVESLTKLHLLLERMVQGTKMDGVNCIVLNSNIRETDLLTGMELDPNIELNMTTSEAKQLLAAVYTGWELVYTTVKSLEFTIERGGRQILLGSDAITYVVKRAG